MYISYLVSCAIIAVLVSIGVNYYAGIASFIAMATIISAIRAAAESITHNLIKVNNNLVSKEPSSMQIKE